MQKKQIIESHAKVQGKKVFLQEAQMKGKYYLITIAVLSKYKQALFELLSGI